MKKKVPGQFILEASSFSGTYLFFNRDDAEKTGNMLGLIGTHAIQTDDGEVFWSPGKSYLELMTRINQNWQDQLYGQKPAIQPRTSPTLPIETKLQSFLEFVLLNNREK